MFVVFKTLLCVILTIIGAAIGAVAAFFLTYYLCAYIDEVNGATAGNGLVAIGWLFWFITIPVGLMFGGGAGLALGMVVTGRLGNRKLKRLQRLS